MVCQLSKSRTMDIGQKQCGHRSLLQIGCGSFVHTRHISGFWKAPKGLDRQLFGIPRTTGGGNQRHTRYLSLSCFNSYKLCWLVCQDCRWISSLLSRPWHSLLHEICRSGPSDWHLLETTAVSYCVEIHKYHRCCAASIATHKASF